MVVLTGHGDSGAMKQCYDAGVSIFLKKPFNLYEVRGAVKNAIAVKLLTIHLDDQVKERTAELEQRMREVSALNQMFQFQLNQRITIDAEIQELLQEHLRLAQKINDLSQKTHSLSPINLEDAAGSL